LGQNFHSRTINIKTSKLPLIQKPKHIIESIMKKLLLTTALAAGLATCVYGQGIWVLNTSNTNMNTAATSGGLVWTNGPTVGLFDGLNYNLGIVVLGGSDSTSLSPIATIVPNGTSTFTGNGPGTFAPAGLPFEYVVPGVTFGTALTAWIEIQAWVREPAAGGGVGGPYSTLAAAQLGGAYWGQVIFQNPVGGAGSPPLTSQPLSGMPALVLSNIPEPSTLALAGLGAAALLAIRRRK
jgi:hypothetical protein